MRNLSLFLRGLVFIILLMLFPLEAIATEYFVSPAGNDNDQGSRTSPWKTISKANVGAKAGDIITFMAGEYYGSLSPENNGEKGLPIIYRSDKLRVAVLKGDSKDRTISLKKKTHIIVDGFHIRPFSGAWASLNDSSDIIIRNNLFEESRGDYRAFLISASKLIHLINNVFTRNLYVENRMGLGGELLTVWEESSQIIIEGNDFSKSGHSLASFYLTSHLIIRRNIFHGVWGRLFELFNCGPTLFEDNILIGNYHGSGSADSGSKIFTIDGIIRRNIAIRNWDFVIHSASYKYGQFPSFILRDSRIYNNTFTSNASYAWLLSAPNGELSAISRNIWKNNIFYNHTPEGGFRTFYINSAIDSSNLWSNNIISASRDDARTIDRFHSTLRRVIAYTVGEAEKNFPGQFKNNHNFVPNFIDVEKDDYRLKANSPGIDDGDFLTEAAVDGKGKEIRVSDARWFYDGFGIEGEVGDFIVVGPDKQFARIENIDRNTNIIVLDRPLTWQRGEKISLPYAGKRPDLGAFEFEVETATAERRQPDTMPVGIRWDKPEDPQSPLVKIDFEDEDFESWAYMWFWHRRWKGYTRTSETAASGRYSAELSWDNENPIIEASIAPRGWDIDLYPWIVFWYRIPKGVPVGISLEGFPTRVAKGERGVVIAATKSCGSDKVQWAAQQYELVDDDNWHEIIIDARIIRSRYKDIKQLYAFRFYCSTKTQRGQKFLFDNFAILPLSYKKNSQ